MTDFVWLPKSFILQIHSRQIDRHGGGSGIRDEGLLDSALARPLNAFSYGTEDIHELSSLYADGIINNHPFIDGNKRTGFMACITFLAANGVMMTGSMEERLAFTLMLAAGDITAEQYAAWLRANTKANGA